MRARSLTIFIGATLLVACTSSSGSGDRRDAGAAGRGGSTVGAGGKSDGGTSAATGGAISTGGATRTGGTTASGSGGRGGTGGSAVVAGADGGQRDASGGVARRDATVDRRSEGEAGVDAPAADVALEGGRADAVADTAPETKPTIDGGTALHIAIPLYIYPGDGSEWAQVAAAGSAVSYIIANAGDPGGPGPSADTAYTSAIASAHQAGQRVVGYVDTSYATRTLATVQAEVDQWYVFYPQIDGIFLDLTPSSAAQIAGYYQPLASQIRAKPGVHAVIINPGQPDFDEGYMALADVAMSYENPYGSSTDGYGPGEYSAPAWTSKYAADRFWHVILEVADAAAMRNVLALARTRNAGHVYITNYPDPPAYARLPTYFNDEVAAVGP